MYLSSKTSEFETRGSFYSGQGTQRAGVRVAPVGVKPTGVFEVVEMAVLVIVTLLAMVSIIVSSIDDDSRLRAEQASAHAQYPSTGAVDAGSRSRPVDPVRASDPVGR